MGSTSYTSKRLYWAVIAVLGAALCATLTASSARADDKSDYNNLIRSALNEYDAGRYDEAGALFKRAHELSPNARTYRGLGLTYYEGRKYALAITHLSAAIEDTRRPLTPAQRESTIKILRQAEGFVARVRIRLEPESATLEVDGYPAEMNNGELLLDPGEHQLIARAPDLVEERRRIEAIAGSSTEVQMTLSPPQLEVAASAEPTPSETQDQASTDQTPEQGSSGGAGVGPIIVLSAGGALLAGSLVTGLIANGIYSDLKSRCPKGRCSPNDKDATSDKSTGKTLVTATNVLLISGLVVAAAGATWWILAPHDDTEPQVAAACAPTGCMASVQGRF